MLPLIECAARTIAALENYGFTALFWLNVIRD